MHIGISYNPSIDLFYSGLNQTAHILAELFEKYFTVYFIDISNDSLPNIINKQMHKPMHKQMHQIENLDLLIDIDGLIPEYRKRIAKKTIIFLRNFIQFSELDNSVYPELPYSPRDYNVHEIWCWDILNPIETLDSIQTLFPCPIRAVPFIWSPSVADHYAQNVVESNTSNTIDIHV